MNIASVATYKKSERKDIFISIFLGLYVFTCYFPRGTRLDALHLGSVFLYSFLMLTFLKLVVNQTPLKITAYTLWYIAFGVLSTFTYFYALEKQPVITDSYIMFVSLVLTFSFIQYVNNQTSFLRIFWLHACFPLITFAVLFRSGTLRNPGERMGDYEFGNANHLAIVLMISLFCSLWFMFYGKRKALFVNILLTILDLYLMSLSGGRKYVIIPFIFVLALVLFKYWSKKSKLILYLIIFVFLASVAAWAILNIPVLYEQIGIRFEGLFSFINGDIENADPSTLQRVIMIKSGWAWFLQKPTQGYGLNNYKILFLDTWGGAFYAHNNFIELAVDLGLIGLLVYYSMYVYIIARLVKIKDDTTGIRNFFLAFMLVVPIFEIGAVTYHLYVMQTFIGLASAFIWVYEKKRSPFIPETASVQR